MVYAKPLLDDSLFKGRNLLFFVDVVIVPCILLMIVMFLFISNKNSKMVLYSMFVFLGLNILLLIASGLILKSYDLFTEEYKIVPYTFSVVAIIMLVFASFYLHTFTNQTYAKIIILRVLGSTLSCSMCSVLYLISIEDYLIAYIIGFIIFCVNLFMVTYYYDLYDVDNSLEEDNIVDKY